MRTNVWLSLFFVVLHAMPVASGNSGSAPVSPGHLGSGASFAGSNCIAVRPVDRPAVGDDDIPRLPEGVTFDMVAGIDGVVLLPPGVAFDEVAAIRPAGKENTSVSVKESGEGSRPAARASRLSFADVAAAAQVSDLHALGSRLGTVVRPGGASALTESTAAPHGIKRVRRLAATPRRMSVGGFNLTDVTAVSDGESDWSGDEAPPQTAREDLDAGPVGPLTFDHFYAAWVGARKRIEILRKRLGYFIQIYSAAGRSGKMVSLLQTCNELLAEEFARRGSSGVLDFSTREDLFDQYKQARKLYDEALVKASLLLMGNICSHLTGLDVFEPQPVTFLDPRRINSLIPPTCSDCPVNQGRKLSSGVFDPETGLVFKCAWCGEYFLQRFFNKVSRERLKECLTSLVEQLGLAETYVQTITPGFVEA